MRTVLTRDQLNGFASALRLPRGRTGRRMVVLAVCVALAAGVVSLLSISVPATAAVSPGVTERISVNTDGSQGNHDSLLPSVSADGRYVAFESDTAFDPLDATNDPSFGDLDIYVRDTVAHTTTLVSVGQEVGDGVITDVASNGGNIDPSISANGRYIAFSTNARNIPANSPAGNRGVICDRDPDGDGVYGKCSYVQVGDPSVPADAAIDRVVLNADATRMAFVKNFQAGYADLPHGARGDLPPTSDSDLHTVALPQTITVGGSVFNRPFSEDVAISANGAFIAIVEAYLDSSVEFGGSITVLYVYDVAAGTAARFDLGENLQPLDPLTNRVSSPAISGDGRRIAFDDVVDNSANRLALPKQVVYAIDRDPDGNGKFGPATGEPITSAIVSRDRTGAVADGQTPAFSADGRYLAFATDAVNIHNGVDDPDKVVSCVHPSDDEPPPPPPSSGITNISHCDIVVRDLVVDAARARAGQPRLPAELASPSIRTTCKAFVTGATCEGDQDSDGPPALTADGSAVVFESSADDLVGGDTNGVDDVFMRRFTPGLSIPTADFGSVPVGDDETLAVPVTTNGFGPLHVAPGATIGGAQAGDFSVVAEDCSNATLHETETCLVSVRFRPTAEGPRNGTLSLTPAGGKPVTGQLVGVAGPRRAPNLQATPDPLDFGPNLVVTPTAPKTVTVTNTGTANLTITTIAPASAGTTSFPGDYTIDASNCLGKSIPPGGTCTVLVVFTAQNVGPRPALLQFTDNVSTLTQVISMNGSGIQPAITALPPLAPPGFVSQITGTGFPAGKTVVLSLDLMPSQTTQPVADTNGNFTFPLVIFPHTPLGNRQLHATVQGVPQLLPVSIPFLVVPGSLQPPDFAERR